MKNQVDLTKVKKVHKTNHTPFANGYLDAGWVLLGVFTENEPGKGSDTNYVLGWDKDSEPITPKF